MGGMAGLEMSGTAVAHMALPADLARIVGRDSLPIRGFVDDRSVFGVIQAAGTYEPHVLQVLAERLKPGGIFVDVGANIGVHTVAAACLVGPEGRVLALEASPLNHELLEANIAANGCQQVVAWQTGVWDGDQSLQVMHLPEGPGWSYLSEGAPDPKGVAFSVPCATLDALVQRAGLSRVDLLKVDVEGAEPHVLRGAAQVLTTLRPDLLLEINPSTLTRLGGSMRELHDLVTRFGYACTLLGRDGRRLPLAGYADLEQLFAAGELWADLHCTPR